MMAGLYSRVGFSSVDAGIMSRASLRQRQIAALIAQGLTSREIAARLAISSHTVKRHISLLMLKLNVSSRSQIAVIASRMGWDSDL